MGAAEAATVPVSVTTTSATTTNAASIVSPEKRNLAYYNSQITAVEKQIQLAYQNGDTANANRLLKEKQQWEDLRNTYVAEHLPYPVAEQVRLVRMTPEELQQLIDSVVKNIREGEGKTPEQRIDRLEKLLLETQAAKEEVQKAKDELQKTTDEVQKAKDELQKTTEEIQKLVRQQRNNYEVYLSDYRGAIVMCANHKRTDSTYPKKDRDSNDGR